MQRKIKFRGKRINNGEWVYGSYVPSGDEYDNHYIAEPGRIKLIDWVRVIPESIGQSADYFDDNDKEVFEGDIVEVEYGRGKVIFHASCFMIEWIDDPEANMELLTMTPKHLRARESLKVIGNIHDNPELLSK